MTKSKDSGQDALTDELRRESQRTGVDPCAILQGRIRQAKAAGDRNLKRALERAEKFFGCRNRQKRGKRRK